MHWCSAHYFWTWLHSVLCACNVVLITFDLIFLFLVLLSDIYFHAFYLQRHDIIKKRIDAHGSVIEARQDGIGSPKVSNKIFLKFIFGTNIFHIYLWINLSPTSWWHDTLKATQSIINGVGSLVSGWGGAVFCCSPFFCGNFRLLYILLVYIGALF